MAKSPRSSKSARKPRPVGRLLTPAQVDQIVLQPRIHLQLLCLGSGNALMAQNVAAFFNLGAALAFLRKDTARTNMIHLGQDALLEPVREANGDLEKTLVYRDEAIEIMRKTFNMIEGWISLQNNIQMLAAVDVVDKVQASAERQGPLTEVTVELPTRKGIGVAKSSSNAEGGAGIDVQLD